MKKRNAALLAEYVAGVPTPVLAEKYGVKPATVLTITGRAGVKRSPETIRQMAAEAAEKQFAHLADRNAEIIARVERGESLRVVAEAMGMSRKGVEGVVTRHRNRAGSAVEGRGASRAAGGEGVSVSVSFHAQNMQESP